LLYFVFVRLHRFGHCVPLISSDSTRTSSRTFAYRACVVYRHRPHPRIATPLPGILSSRNGGKSQRHVSQHVLRYQAAESLDIAHTKRNVLGRGTLANYLKTLLVDPDESGVQVRCTRLTALDYGIRRSASDCFIFAAQKSGLPGIPPKSTAVTLFACVTVREALYGLGGLTVGTK
jgi:hypothetical protein